jgi:hypothetical protein
VKPLYNEQNTVTEAPVTEANSKEMHACYQMNLSQEVLLSREDFVKLHKITQLEQSGNNFKGKAKLLETPMGKIAKSLLGEGVMLGVSSRGVGSLKEDHTGCKVVGEDFQLATAADIVADPSAPDAFVNGIMEGKEWVWQGGLLREQLAEKTKKSINTLVTQNRLEEKKLSLFNNFLNNL